MTLATNPTQRYTLAELCDRSGDLSKRWFVRFSAYDPATRKLRRSKQFWCPAQYTTAATRRAWAKKKCHEINTLLTSGYEFYVASPPTSHVTQSEPAVLATVNKVPIELRTTFDLRPATFVDALDRLLSLRAITHRDRTHDTNRDTVNRWKQFCAWLNAEKQIDLLPMPIDGLTGSDLNAFSDYLLQERSNSNRTRNNLLGDLRTLVNLMSERGWLAGQAFPKWGKLIESPTRIHDVYTAEQRQVLISHLRVHDHRLLLLVQFIYYTFLRPIELTRIRVRDVDLQNNRILIHKSDAKGGRKSAGFEVVVINEQFRQYIDEMNLQIAHPNYYLFGRGLLTCGVQTVRNRLSERHSQALRDCGLYNELLSFYGHKHTGVVRAYQAGADIVWLQKQLRHASLDDTQIYLRALGLLPPERLKIEW